MASRLCKLYAEFMETQLWRPSVGSEITKFSGLEVTKWLKEDAERKAIPVVAVTAFAMRGDEEWGTGIGFDK